MAARNDIRFNVDIDKATAARQLQELWNEGTEDARKKFDALAGAKVTTEVIGKFVTDDKGVQSLQFSLEEVGSLWDAATNKLNAYNKIQDGSVTKLRQQVNEAKQVRDQTARIVVDANELGKVVSRTNDEWTEANNRVQRLSRELAIASASSFWDKIKAELNLGPLLGAGKAVNELVNTFQSLSIIIGQVTAPINTLIKALGGLQQFSLTFDAIGLGASEVNKVFTESSRIALTYGTNIQAVRTGFEKLTPTLIAAGASTDDVSNIVEALSTRFVAFGLSADESNRVMNAVVQAFGKGKLQAEELTQQISEADPAFRVDFANAVGVSVSKLNEMIEAGEVTTDVMIDVIPKMQQASIYFEKLGTSATSAVDAFKQGVATIDQVRNQINNLNQLSLENLAKSFTGFLAGVLDIQAAFTDLFSTLSGLGALQTIGNILGSLLSLFADIISIVNGVIAVFDTLFGGVFDLINAIDGFVESLINIKPIATAIAAILAIGLANSVVELVKQFAQTESAGKYWNLLKDVVTAGAEGIKKAVEVAKNVFSGLGNAISAGVNAAGKALVPLFDGLDNVYKSFDRVNEKSKLTAQQLSYLPADLVALSSAGQDAGEGVGAAAGGIDAAGKSGKGLGASFKALMIELLPLVVIFAAISAGMELYNGLTKVSGELSKEFSRIQAELGKTLQNSAGVTENAADASERFSKQLRDLGEENQRLERNFDKTRAVLGLFTFGLSEIVYDTIDLTQAFADFQVTGDISNTIKVVQENFAKLDLELAKVRKSLAEYEAAGVAASEASRARIENQITAVLTAYGEQIKAAYAARDKLLQEIAARGEAGATEAQRKGLERLNATINEVETKVAKVIQEFQNKGIIIPVSADTKPASTSLEALDGQIKGLTNTQKKIPFGTQYYEEVVARIQGLKALADLLVQKPYDLKIKIIQEGELESVKSTLSVYEAIVDNLKARAEVENSYTSIVRANNDYILNEITRQKDAYNQLSNDRIKSLETALGLMRETSAETDKAYSKEVERLSEIKDAKLEQYNEELERLRETGASKDQIAAKEKEIKEYTKQKTKEISDLQKQQDAEREAALANQKEAQKQIQAEKDAAEARNQQYLDEERRQKEIIKEIEKQAARDKLDQLLIIQQAEAIAFSLKQKQEISEFEILKLKNQAALAEAASAVQAAKLLVLKEQQALAEMKIKAFKDGIINEQELQQLINQRKMLEGANNMVIAAENNYNAQQKISNAFKDQEQDFINRQRIERETFLLNQTAQENAARANIAALEGIGAAAKEAGGKVKTITAGTIEAGGQIVTVYRNVQEEADKSSYKLQKVAVGTMEVGGKIVTLYNEIAVKDPGKPLREGQVAANEMATGVFGVNSAMNTTNNQTVSRPFDEAKTKSQELTLEISKVSSQLGQISTLIAPAVVSALDKMKLPLQGAERAAGAVVTKLSILGDLVTSTDFQTRLAMPLQRTAEATERIARSQFQRVFQEANNKASPLAANADSIRNNVETTQKANLKKPFEEAVAFAATLRQQTGIALTNVQKIVDAFNSLNGKRVTITINTVQARAGGGPVVAGAKYQVNEIGKEAFLSSSGKLSMIQKPAYGTWRAPSDGVVIPANITSKLDVPSTGVSYNRSIVHNMTRNSMKDNSADKIARAVEAALSNSTTLSRLKYTEDTQALHAAQIGKLTHAINKLVDKNWGVNVNIKDRSGGKLPRNMSSLL